MSTKAKIQAILMNCSQKSVIGWSIEESDFEAVAEEIIKKLGLCDVGSSLPSKEELLSISENIIEEKHKGLDELEKKYMLLGFLYYHRYLYDKSNSR